ncbi:hypothetical protein FKM82_005317 [Ascaphus truei]
MFALSLEQRMDGYGGYCPQLRYQLGNTYGKATHLLLTDPSVMKSPHSILPPVAYRDNDWAKDRSPSGSNFLWKKEVEPSERYIPGYTGHLPLGQFEQGATFAKMATNSREKFLGFQQAREDQRLQPMQVTYDNGAKEFINTYQRLPLRPIIKSDAYLPMFIKPSRIELPKPLQRKAISGYTGFIPRYTWSMGASFMPAVKNCMDEFDRSQIQIRYPLDTERKLKPTYWPQAKIYQPTGLIPKYTGFVPGIRSTFGGTYGNTTRQLYWQYPF